MQIPRYAWEEPRAARDWNLASARFHLLRLNRRILIAIGVIGIPALCVLYMLAPESIGRALAVLGLAACLIPAVSLISFWGQSKAGTRYRLHEVGFKVQQFSRTRRWSWRIIQSVSVAPHPVLPRVVVITVQAKPSYGKLAMYANDSDMPAINALLKRYLKSKPLYIETELHRDK